MSDKITSATHSREEVGRIGRLSRNQALRRSRRFVIIKQTVDRVGQLAAVVFFVTVGTAVLLRVVPGDPARTILGSHATPQSLGALRRQLGLNESVPSQVAQTIVRLVHANLGTSIVYRGQSVLSVVAPSFGVTASLVGVTMLMSVIVGIPIGLGLAVSRSSFPDLVGRLALTVAIAVPSFLVGLLLLLGVSLKLGWAPPGGWAGSWPTNARYVWLPAVALTAYLGPVIARAVRQMAQDTISQPFIEAACARGIPRRRVIWRYVFPNALLPVITLLGYSASILISGAVTVEAVFALPGVGQILTTSVQARDYPVVQGIALITAIGVVAINLLTDVIYTLLDPRIGAAA